MNDGIRAQLQETLGRILGDLRPLVLAFSADLAESTQSEDDTALALRQLAAVSRVLDDAGLANVLLDAKAP